MYAFIYNIDDSSVARFCSNDTIRIIFSTLIYVIFLNYPYMGRVKRIWYL